MFTCVLIW